MNRSGHRARCIRETWTLRDALARTPHRPHNRQSAHDIDPDEVGATADRDLAAIVETDSTLPVSW